jgi:hypothetical protein
MTSLIAPLDNEAQTPDVGRAPGPIDVPSCDAESLRSYFTDDQIAELGMFAALMSGSGGLAYAFPASEG